MQNAPCSKWVVIALTLHSILAPDKRWNESRRSTFFLSISQDYNLKPILFVNLVWPLILVTAAP